MSASILDGSTNSITPPLKRKTSIPSRSLKADQVFNGDPGVIFRFSSGPSYKRRASIATDKPSEFRVCQPGQISSNFILTEEETSVGNNRLPLSFMFYPSGLGEYCQKMSNHHIDICSDEDPDEHILSSILGSTTIQSCTNSRRSSVSHPNQIAATSSHLIFNTASPCNYLSPRYSMQSGNYSQKLNGSNHMKTYQMSSGRRASTAGIISQTAGNLGPNIISRRASTLSCILDDSDASGMILEPFSNHNRAFSSASFAKVQKNRNERPKSISDQYMTDDDDSTDYLTRKGMSRKKECASCGVKKTPYWRDGWDPSILLCNACGIRYQKYKRYCVKCTSIARKDEKGRLHCPVCFDKL